MKSNILLLLILSSFSIEILLCFYWVSLVIIEFLTLNFNTALPEHYTNDFCSDNIDCQRLMDVFLFFQKYNPATPLLTPSIIVGSHLIFFCTGLILIFIFDVSSHKDDDIYKNEKMINRLNTLIGTLPSRWKKYNILLVSKKSKAIGISNNYSPYTRFSTIYIPFTLLFEEQKLLPMLFHEEVHLTKFGYTEPLFIYLLNVLKISFPIMLFPFALLMNFGMGYVGLILVFFIVYLPYMLFSKLRKHIYHAIEVSADIHACCHLNSLLLSNSMDSLSCSGSDTTLIEIRTNLVKQGILNQIKFVKKNIESYIRTLCFIGIFFTISICSFSDSIPEAFGLKNYLSAISIITPIMFLISIYCISKQFDFDFKLKRNSIKFYFMYLIIFFFVVAILYIPVVSVFYKTLFIDVSISNYTELLFLFLKNKYGFLWLVVMTESFLLFFVIFNINISRSFNENYVSIA